MVILSSCCWTRACCHHCQTEIKAHYTNKLFLQLFLQYPSSKKTKLVHTSPFSSSCPRICQKQFSSCDCHHSCLYKQQQRQIIINLCLTPFKSVPLNYQYSFTTECISLQMTQKLNHTLASLPSSSNQPLSFELLCSFPSDCPPGANLLAEERKYPMVQLPLWSGFWRELNLPWFTPIRLL